MFRGRKLKKLYRKRLKGGWRSHLHSGAAPFHGNVFPVSELSWLRSCRKKKKVQLILSTAGRNPGLCEKLLSSQRLQKSTEERTDKKLHGDASNSSSACYRGKVFSNHREDCVLLRQSSHCCSSLLHSSYTNSKTQLSFQGLACLVIEKFFLTNESGMPRTEKHLISLHNNDRRLFLCSFTGLSFFYPLSLGGMFNVR